MAKSRAFSEPGNPLPRKMARTRINISCNIKQQGNTKYNETF